jgi:glycosyltransferase involved in cell wall biosynthesis
MRVRSIDAPPLPDRFTLLQVTPALDAGGVEQATLDMAGAVARLGRRSLVASRGGWLEARLAARGGELVRLPLHARDPVSLAANAARLAAVVIQEKVSLIHVRSRAPAFSALLAAWATRAPMVATYHGIYSARSGLKRWYNAVMTRGDAVIANSDFTRRHIVAEHGIDPDRIDLVPEGVDMDRFDPSAVSARRVAAMRASWGLAPDEARVVILLAARLTGWKGHKILAEAFQRLPNQDRAVLVITNAKDGSPLAMSLATACPSARLTGDCTDMPAAFLAADLVAAPSTKAESFGRSVVEAGAMSRPVLASAVGAHTETIVPGETGWLAPPGDVAAWTAALDFALSTPSERRLSMGRAARERAVRLYSLTTMYARTFAIYRRVLEARA